MTTTKRSWTRTEYEDRTIVWLSDDGLAEVCVTCMLDGWQVVVHENGQYIGSEPVSPYRSGAVVIAKKWLKALGRPMI